MADTCSHPSPADFCCICTFPMPSLCAVCKEAHLSCPGFHYLLPTEARDQVKSQQQLREVQRQLHRLFLTYKEAETVLISFQQALESVQKAYQEVQSALTAAYHLHIAQLQAAELAYRTRLDQAISTSYENAWKHSDFQPSDPFLGAIWTHSPGKDTTFRLFYNIETDLQALNQLITVKWALPFPDFGSCPETAFPVKIVLETGALEGIITQPSATIAEIRSELGRKGTDVSANKRFCDEMGALPEDWKPQEGNLVGVCQLYLTSRWIVRLINSDWKVYTTIVDPENTIKDLISGLPADLQQFPANKYLIYDDQWLNESKTVAESGLVSGSTVRVTVRIPVPFNICLEMPNGHLKRLIIPRSDLLIGELKAVIETSEGLWAGLYDLVYKARVLEEGKTVDFYNICRGERVKLVAKQTGKWEIGVKWSKLVKFQVDFWDSIEDLKAEIQKQGISTGRGLKFDGNMLKNDRLIVSYGLPSGYTFQLSLGTIEITIRTVKGRELALKVEDTDQIEGLKQRIGEWRGSFEAEIRLFYAGKELESGTFVADYNIAPGAVIQEIGNIRIFVKTLKGKTVQIECENTNLIADIKVEIEREEGTPADLQLLVYAGKQLEGSCTLADYRLRQESVLILALKQAVDRHPGFSISVVSNRLGETRQLQVDSSLTVETVKKEIRRSGLHFSEDPEDEPILLYAGQMLQDSWTLGDCCLLEGAVVEAV